MGENDNKEPDGLLNLVDRLSGQNRELQQVIVELEDKARRDPKFRTFYNQGAAYEAFTHRYIDSILLMRQQGRDSSAIAAYFIDLDDMKAANERLGHQGVDRKVFPALEKEINEAISSSMREEDLVIQDGFPSRYGGDEFNIFAFGIRSEDDAYRLAERLRRQVKRHRFMALDGKSYSQKISIGGHMYSIKEDRSDWQLELMLDQLVSMGVNPADQARRGMDGKRTDVWDYWKRKSIGKAYRKISAYLGLEKEFSAMLSIADKQVYHVKENGKDSVRITSGEGDGHA